MYKLVVLIETQDDMLNFEQHWPEFLAAAEQMPGLIRETASPVHTRIFGDLSIAMIHELYFADQDALRKAMSSPFGQQAGQVLQVITGGKVTLLLAEHMEDEIANIRPPEIPPQEGPPGDRA